METTQKLIKLKRKLLIIIMMTLENFAARLTQLNFTSKNDIANFINKTDFDDTLKHLNRKVTSNKAIHRS